MKEEDIRPQEIFNEYLRLCEEDSRVYFAGVELETCACPACESVGNWAFKKSNFDYSLCDDCRTLYVSPRPPADAFSKYYTESESARYWATTFYRQTEEARRQKLWKPKARMILEVLDSHRANGFSVIDIGGGYGVFAEEMGALIDKSVTVVEPSPFLAQICTDKEIRVVQKFLEEVVDDDLPSGPRAFVSFELFEHLHDPASFLNCLKQLMRPGDLFIFTTLSGVGIDILALWENSKSVSPPHHLNFLNPYSIKILLDRLGFETLNVETPGKLDIDILSNSLGNIKDRFWSTFLHLANDSEKEHWQNFIAASGWSSHMMVSCRRP